MSILRIVSQEYLAEDIKDPATGEVIVAANHMVTPKRAEAILRQVFRRLRSEQSLHAVHISVYVLSVMVPT